MSDLISREALKLTIENFQIFNPKLSVYDVLKIIDNAPTVEPKITEVDNVSPCTNCQEFDCYGCKVKEADNENN